MATMHTPPPPPPHLNIYRGTLMLLTTSRSFSKGVKVAWTYAISVLVNRSAAAIYHINGIWIPFLMVYKLLQYIKYLLIHVCLNITLIEKMSEIHDKK